MKIASQHAWKDREYSPRHDWPGDTLVQWGGKGVVLGRESYTTAFFEAFPDQSITTAGGFIRGEGKTIADAEDDAFARFQKQNFCNHLWGREKYTNSGQLCRHCRAFRHGQVKPIVKLGEWRAPIHWTEEWMMDGDNKYAHILRLRAKLFGVIPRPEKSPLTAEDA